MWNHKKINAVLGNEDEAIQWCKDNGLVPKKRTCYGKVGRRHRKTKMTFYECKNKFGAFVCPKCEKSSDLLVGTWFEEGRIPVTKIFRLGLYVIMLLILHFSA